MEVRHEVRPDVRGHDRRARQWEKLSKEQLDTAYQRVGQWFEEHGKAGRIVGGEELCQNPAERSLLEKKLRA